MQSNQLVKLPIISRRTNLDSSERRRTTPWSLRHKGPSYSNPFSGCPLHTSTLYWIGNASLACPCSQSC